MHKSVWAIVIVILAVLLVWFGFGSKNASAPENTEETSMNDTAAETDTADIQQHDNTLQDGRIVITYNIKYTENGFQPADISIKAGDVVTFINESDRDMWPASDIHPTHTVYPGSDINKCFDGSDTSEIFDSCGPVNTYSFTFDEPGEWNYHNHKRPNDGGTITVN